MTLPMKSGMLGAKVFPPAPRQVANLTTPIAASPPLHLNRYFRNGMHPDANAMNAMNAAANQSIMYRSKEAFSILGNAQQIPSSASGSTPLWRFAFHTGPYTHGLGVVVVMVPPTSGYDQVGTAKLSIYSDTAEATLVTSAEFVYGSNPTGSAASGGHFPYWKVLSKTITGLSPDTAYYAKFSNENYGRLQSASVSELASMSEHSSGYFAENIDQQTPIVDIYRENLAVATRNLWRRAGSKVFNWTTDGINTRTSIVTTPTNVVNNTSTTISASTPGFTIDMSGKTRLSQSTVPCIMKVHASHSSATLNGAVYLKNSAGTTIATIANAWSTGTGAHWESVAFNMPAGVDKYDLMFAKPTIASGTFTLNAVDVWEHE